MRLKLSAITRLVWLYARRSVLYNLALSLLGTSVLFAVSLAAAASSTAALDRPQPFNELATQAFRVPAVMTGILVMTLGHALGLVAMRLFHARELPYYRNAGLGEGVLALGSWLGALVVGAVLLTAGLIWT